jgi:hypothetical protein
LSAESARSATHSRRQRYSRLLRDRPAVRPEARSPGDGL